MAKSPTRRLHLQIAKLEDQLEVERAAFAHDRQFAEHKLALSQAAQKGLDGRIFMLQQEVQSERIQRVAAQRGLVRYMTAHGLVDRIGYDPDQDITVQKDIAEGRIQPLGTEA